MLVKREYNRFDDLYENSWSRAIDTLNVIMENGLEEELMYHLEEVFYDNIPTATQLNDYLWFKSEYIFESLGIAEEEEEE